MVPLCSILPGHGPVPNIHVECTGASPIKGRELLVFKSFSHAPIYRRGFEFLTPDP